MSLYPLPANQTRVSPRRFLGVICGCGLGFWALACGPAAVAGDRLAVIAPPAAQDSAEKLANSLAAACNRRDFPGFMDHFTASHGRRVRDRMEDFFVQNEPTMTIRQVTLLSEADDRITFGVRYAWHDRSKPEEMFASKVTARKLGDEWKLDGEVVKAVTSTAAVSLESTADAAVQPAAWDPFNPQPGRFNPALEHLRGDIGIRPGMGCANGRCGR